MKASQFLRALLQMIAVHIADGDKFDSASLERGPGVEHPPPTAADEAEFDLGLGIGGWQRSGHLAQDDGSGSGAPQEMTAGNGIHAIGVARK